MRISVCISDAGDDRIARTLRSLSSQGIHEVLVERRGTVAESRNRMYQESSGDILVFIDTDQEVPPGWVEALSDPLRDGDADFTCGPTRPHPDPRSRSAYAAYHAELERRHYLRCRNDQTVFPMGNSMWARYVLEAVASSRSTAVDRAGSTGAGVPFDERFTMGGEDFDINLRATRLGFRGAFVDRAWVWHDQSNLDNPLKIMRRKLRYCYGGALAHLTNGTRPIQMTRVAVLSSPSNGTATLRPYVHWLEGFQKVAQAAGFAAALWSTRSWMFSERRSSSGT